MPDISVLQELSRILEVSVDELLAGEYAEEGRAENRITERRKLETAGRVRTGENWFLCEKAYYCRYPFSAAVSCDLHAGRISVCERKRSV